MTSAPELTAYDAAGRPLRLRSLGKGGGEGSIYLPEGGENICAKIYLPAKLAAQRDELRAKVVVMVQRPPDDPAWVASRHRSIAWPTAPLFADARQVQFLGFLMPLLDIGRLRESHQFYEHTDRLRQFGTGVGWRHMVTAATNLASAVAAIHDKGHRVGDIRESNVLVGRNALVTLIDCDSFEVAAAARGTRFYCRVGTPGYLPPELMGIDLGKEHRDRYASDLFGLGVLTFQFLMDGFHPYQSRGRPVENLGSLDAKLTRGYFAYGGKVRDLLPPPDAPDYAIVPPALAALFHRCFVDGHKNPAARPTAAQWFAALRAEQGRLKICSASPAHIFGHHLSHCPWCAMEQSSGPILFPDGPLVGQQIALDEPSAAEPIETRRAYLRSHVAIAAVDGVITPAEQEHVRRLALHLQLPKSDVDRIIANELQKAGATAAAPSSPGRPTLELSEQQIEFGHVKPGTSERRTVRLANVGGGTLSGSITADKPWIQVSSPAIDTARHQQSFVVTVTPAAGQRVGTKYRGSVAVRSNGGKADLPVSVTIFGNPPRPPVADALLVVVPVVAAAVCVWWLWTYPKLLVGWPSFVIVGGGPSWCILLGLWTAEVATATKRGRNPSGHLGLCSLVYGIATPVVLDVCVCVSAILAYIITSIVGLFTTLPLHQNDHVGTIALWVVWGLGVWASPRTVGAADSLIQARLELLGADVA